VGGAVKCWGDGFYGQLGNGSVFGSPTPVSAKGIANALGVGCGEYHTCALLAGGAVECWGSNDDGQLGNGNLPNSSGVPTGVANLGSGVDELSVGSSHSCARVGGAIDCWGLNAVGQVGGTTNAIDVPFNVLKSGATSVTAGLQTSCAASAGHVYCWGYNGEGQIVANGEAEYGQPTLVPGADGIGVLAVGGGHACGLTNAVLCWGDDRLGQQGSGTISGAKDRPPTAVPGIAGVTAISAGQAHTCALAQGGHVFCWGSNADGQLGEPSAPPASAVPVGVHGL
jgi:alpha-tubulin suppressor-like RCC1 family protein